jgi:glycosyltransferase involved in cell wall biosynthesis
MKKRVAVIASHVIQYQDPFFRLLAADPEIDLTVIYGSRAGLEVYRDEDMGTSLRWDIELLAGYRSEFLRNFGFSDGYTRLINPGVVMKIMSGRFDAVILMLGWGSITALLAMAACRATGTPIMMFGDSSYPPPETTIPRKIRGLFLRAVTALTSRFLVSGALNADYYAHYGADRKHFFGVPWAIDNERFANASRFEAGEREAMRARFGIRPGDVAIVFSAKLVARKDPMTLLRACAQMRQRHRAALVFLGDGELRPALDAFVREEQLERVTFAGFVNQTELPKYYAMCDVFVLPSLYEPRGSVINEAMACGLPVIVSDRTGAIGDIVREGENAFVFPAGDAARLATGLDRLADDGVRARMAERSRELIAAWDYRSGVEGVKAALRSLP